MQRVALWLKWVGGGIVLLAVVVVLAAITIFRTESGTRWTINLLQANVPGTIEIDLVGGTLWSGMNIADFHYRNQILDLQASNIVVAVDWPQMVAGTLYLRELRVASVTYEDLRPSRQDRKPFELTIPALPVALDLDAAFVNQLHVILQESQTEISQLSLQSGQWSEHGIRIRRVAGVTSGVEATIHDLNAGLSGDIPLSSSVEWRLKSREWSGRGTVSGSLAGLDFSQTMQGPYPAFVSGQVVVMNRISPEITGTLTWQQWQFDVYRFENGSVDISGTIDQYSANYEWSVALPLGGPAQIAGSAIGNAQGLSDFKLEVTSSSGELSSAGSLNWLPSFAADASVRVADFDPGIAVTQLSGRIDAVAQVRVVGNEALEISALSASGILNNAELIATGNVKLTPHDLQCNLCVVELGDNRLSIDGARGVENTALALSIDAPNLRVLWPDIDGSLKGDGNIGGDSANPYFSGEVSGRALVFRDWAADELAILSRDSTADTVDITLNAKNLSNNKSRLGSFTVVGRGAPDNLDLNVDWSRQQISVSVVGNATTDDLGFKSIVSRAEISDPHTGTWALEGDLTATIQGDDVAIDPHLWSNGVARFRLDRAVRESGSIELLAELSQFQLQTANNWLPENYNLSGTASAAIDISQQVGLWTGSVDWRQNDTVLSVTDADRGKTDVIFSEFSANAVLQDGGVDVAAAVTVEPGVRSNLTLSMNTLAADADIDAELNINGKELEWISAIAPMIDNISGAVAATVNATGNISAPAFNGSLNWQDGSLAIPALNVPLSEIDLTVLGADNGAATVKGRARAGGGELSIDGRLANVMQSSRSIALTVNGTDAELINWPSYHVWASPSMEITGDGGGWNFAGEVEVPRAEIEIRQLPEDAVLPSEDVTVLGRTEEIETTTQVSGDSRLVLGEAVHVRAFGLDTKLQGDLRIRMTEDRPPRATGKVELVDGTFSAYGQKLTIREGTLTFTGSLEDPLVDVRAIREVETLDGQVTAGIHLRGRGQALTSTIYSEPAMPEADALSYLVLGRPLNQATESEGNELSGAAIALGTKQAARITDQLGQAFGLDQLAVTGGGRSTTALVAGKQINNRLHARYAYGVFSRLGTLLLRYRLSKRVTLEAASGEEESIDILYQVEKQ